jgi:hypothetical protein
VKMLVLLIAPLVVGAVGAVAWWVSEILWLRHKQRVVTKMFYCGQIGLRLYMCADCKAASGVALMPEEMCEACPYRDDLDEDAWEEGNDVL